MKTITHYLLITALLCFTSYAEEDLLKDNILIVFDASGSMNNPMDNTNRMTIAKKAITTVVKTLDPNSNLGMLVFSGANKKSDWLHNLGPLNQDVLQRNLSKLGPSGGTPLGAYMRIAKKALEDQRKKQLGYGTYRMLILTDGQASDSQKVLEETPKVLKSGIYLDVIGVAMDNSHILATRANSYRSAMDEKALLQAIEKVFSEVSDKVDNKDTQETFELLKPLENDVAKLMLKGMTSAPENLKGMIAASQKSSPNATQSQPSNTSHQPKAVNEKIEKKLNTNTFFFIVGAFFFAVILIKSKLKS